MSDARLLIQANGCSRSPVLLKNVDIVDVALNGRSMRPSTGYSEFRENSSDDKELPAAAWKMVKHKRRQNQKNCEKMRRRGGMGGRARNDYLVLLPHGVARTALRKNDLFFH